jgi:hypothetical protein
MTHETCDRCGPSVKAEVKTEHGLTFCAHCHRQYGGVIVDVSPAYDVTCGYVTDNSKTPDPEPVSSGACSA